MLSLAHATTGAFVASKFTHPLIYIPLAIGLHYVQDWIPTGMSARAFRMALGKNLRH